MRKWRPCRPVTLRTAASRRIPTGRRSGRPRRRRPKRCCRPTWPPGTTVLELGCGVGLVGLAALVRGWHVTFSDYTPQAIRVALENARQNGFRQAQSLLIDWHDPPSASYGVILASDVLYQRASHAPFLRAIERLMSPDGVCWIGDPGRLMAREFFQAATERFHVQLRDRDGHEFGVPHVGEFQLLVLRRRTASYSLCPPHKPANFARTPRAMGGSPTYNGLDAPLSTWSRM